MLRHCMLNSCVVFLKYKMSLPLSCWPQISVSGSESTKSPNEMVVAKSNRPVKETKNSMQYFWGVIFLQSLSTYLMGK